MDEEWEVLRSFLPAGWEDLGRSSGALKGLRKDKSAEAVLRVLLLHLGCGHSLRETVVRAREAGLAELSDVALLKRLRKSSDWLHGLCVALFRERGMARAAGSGLRVRAFDATTVREPGRTGSVWRVHYSLCLSSLRCDFFEVTPTRGVGSAEYLSRFPVGEGDHILADRGYATAAGASPRVGGGRAHRGAGEHRGVAAADPGGGAARPAGGAVRAGPRRGGRIVAGGGGRGARAPLRGAQVDAGRRTGAQEGAPRGAAPGQRGQARNACLCRLRHRLHHLPGTHLQRPARFSNGTACAGRSSWSSSASSRSPGSATCPSATTTAPVPGSTESSWSRCWSTSWSTTPAPFPPGDTSWRRRRPHSPWREFRFVLNEVQSAIEPPFGLARTIDGWNDIAKHLAEPPRRRRPQRDIYSNL